MAKLTLYSGSKRSKNNIAIITHGLLSQPYNMQKLAYYLDDGTFDAIYLFDSQNYFENANSSGLTIDDLVHLFIVLARSRVLAIGAAGYNIAEHIYKTAYDAGDELAELVQESGFKNVCLIGHSLGGIVSRYALEAHDLRSQVRSIISLDTPHILSQVDIIENRGWDGLPWDEIPYLNLMAEKGPFFYQGIKRLSEICYYGAEMPNGINLIYPDVDHSTIHSKAKETYIPELITHFHERKGFHSKQYVCCVKGDNSIWGDYLYLTEHTNEFHPSCFMPASNAYGWLFFTSEEPEE